MLHSGFLAVGLLNQRKYHEEKELELSAERSRTWRLWGRSHGELEPWILGLREPPVQRKVPSPARSNVTIVSFQHRLLWLADCYSSYLSGSDGAGRRRGGQGGRGNASGRGKANAYPARTNILITALGRTMGTSCHSNLHGPQFTAVSVGRYLLDLCQHSLWSLHLSLWFVTIITGVMILKAFPPFLF